MPRGTEGVGGNGTHILRDEARDENKGRLGGREHARVAEDVPVHEARREAQVLGAGAVHLAHDAPRDLAVDGLEEGLAAAQDLGGRRVVDLGVAVGGGGPGGLVQEVRGRRGLQGQQGVNCLVPGGVR